MTQIIKVNEMMQDASSKVVFKTIGVPKYSFNAMVLGISYTEGESVGTSYQTDGTEPLMFQKNISAAGTASYTILDNISYINFNKIRYFSPVVIKANTKYTFAVNFKADVTTSQRLLSLGTVAGQIIGLTVNTAGTELSLLHGASSINLSGYEFGALNKVAIHITDTQSFAVVNGIVTDLAVTPPTWAVTSAYLMGSSNITTYTSNYLVSLFEVYEDIDHTKSQLISYTL